MIKEFKGFLLKQNALALAIGVIIGAAVGKLVSAIADDVINPIVGLLLPGGEWRTAKFDLFGAAITYGHLIGAAIDFVIISFVVYMIAKAFIPKPGEAKPTTKECPQCRELIPIAATRCKACTQPVG